MDEHKVHIIEWPKEKARLDHYFNLDEPCPISIIFDDKPVQVQVTSSEKEPFYVDMKMHLTAKETIPVCIKICEPICATSDYTVGITLFGQPVVGIGVKGVTRLATCRDNGPSLERICQTHDDCKAGKVEPSPYMKDNISYAPVNGDSVQWVSLLAPPVPAQILIPHDGLRITFTEAVQKPELDIVNYADPVIHIEVYLANTLVHSSTEVVQQTRRRIILPVHEADMLIVKGGNSRAGLVEICYLSSSKETPKTSPKTKMVSIITHK